MNYLAPGQPPSAMYPPPKKPFPVVPLVLGIVGLLIALAVLGGIKGFRAMKENSSEAITVGNSFIDAMGQHQYSAARSLFTPDVQTRTPADDLKDMETLVEKHHGAFVHHGQPQWFVQNYNGQTSVRLTYPAQFTKSPSTVSFVLVKTGSGYQVYAAHYDF